MDVIDTPTRLTSHFFWLWYWREHQRELKDMNARANHSQVFWTYPSTLHEFRDAFEKCPVCGGDGIKRFNPVTVKNEKGTRGFTVSEVYCVCNMVEYLARGRHPIESHIKPFEFDQFMFNVEPWDRSAKPLKDKVIALKQWAKFPLNWLYLYGAPGSGKSSALAAIKKELGNLAFYITAPELHGMVFDSLNDSTSLNVQQIIKTLSGAPVLLVDDLGHQYDKGDFVPSIVAAVVDRRYKHGILAPMVVTSNVTPVDFLGTNDRYMRRAADRILDRNISYELFFNAKSYRTGA